MKSDSAGRFAIETKIGDILTIKSLAYVTDTLAVISFKNQEIFLLPKIIELEEVTVKSATMNLGVLRHPEYHGQTVVYPRNGDGSYKGGVVFRIYYWNKDSKKVRRSKQKLK